MALRAPDNRLGLWYMLLGMCLFACTDALAKYLTQSLPPMQVVWLRQSGLFLGIVIILCLRGRQILHTTHPKAQIARGALAAVSAALFVIAVSYVPLADAVAITFVAPFIVTVMGAVLLREPVGLRRWAAVIVGFVGTLIVLRPGMGVLHPAAFLLIIAATAFAIRQILSRVLARGDRTVTTVAYTAIVSWSLLALAQPFVWQTPTTAQQVVLLILMAVLAAGGETLVIMALDAAQAVVVAPVQYVLLIWGTFFGYVLFDQLPDGWTLLGSAIVVMTGLYIFDRERRLTKVTT